MFRRSHKIAVVTPRFAKGNMDVEAMIHTIFITHCDNEYEKYLWRNAQSATHNEIVLTLRVERCTLSKIGTTLAFQELN
jgi:hypothetical protein